MATRSKRYKEAASGIDSEMQYSISEAVKLLKSGPKATFDETVEFAAQLGIDPKNSDQQIRTSIGLPHGTGKPVSVAVFAEGDAAEAAREAGADFVGDDDLIARVEAGWMDFDIVLANPPIMRKIGKLGRVLGPRGLMPNPKNGTLTSDLGAAVSEFKAGKVEIRNDDGANVHVPVGKLSFGKAQIEENVIAIVKHLKGMRPPGVGHLFFRKAVLTSTMSPSVRLRI